MEYTLTKQISKQGKNLLIIIPKMIQDNFKPKDLVEVKIRLLKKET